MKISELINSYKISDVKKIGKKIVGRYVRDNKIFKFKANLKQYNKAMREKNEIIRNKNTIIM